MSWVPVPDDLCPACGRATPDYYRTRDEDIAKHLGYGVSSPRMAKAYGLSEERVREIAIRELGKAAYLARMSDEEARA